MPSAPLKICSHGGCPALTGERFCPRHKYEYIAHRGSPAQRGYDADWQRARNVKLASNPLCEECQRNNRTTPATEVHHVVALRKGGARLDIANLEALCKSCHSTKTKRGE